MLKQFPSEDGGFKPLVGIKHSFKAKIRMNIKYLIPLFTFFAHFLYSQDFQPSLVEYTITMGERSFLKEKDNKSEGGSRQKMSQRLTAYQNTASTFVFTLLMHKNESIFRLKNNLSMGIDKNQDALYRGAIALVDGHSVHYQNIKENLHICQKESQLTYELYLITDSLFSKDWNITKEKKKIGQFQCVKATKEIIRGKKKIIEEVWFAPEIPIPFGPMGYGGLPGLIVEVTKLNSGIPYTVRLSNISTPKKAKIKRPVKGQVISPIEYVEMERRVYETHHKQR